MSLKMLKNGNTINDHQAMKAKNQVNNLQLNKAFNWWSKGISPHIKTNHEIMFIVDCVSWNVRKMCWVCGPHLYIYLVFWQDANAQWQHGMEWVTICACSKWLVFNGIFGFVFHLIILYMYEVVGQLNHIISLLSVYGYFS